MQLGDAVIVERLPLVFLHDVQTGPVVRLQEGGSHNVRARFDRHRNVDRAVIFTGHSLAQSDTNVVDQLHSLAINEKLDLFAGNISADTKILDRKLVFAIGRKIVVNEHSPACSQRKTFDMMSLPDVARRNIARFRRRLPVTDRHSRNPRCRCCVSFQQGWGYRQRTRNIVKASGRIVGRQKLRRIDLDVEKVVNDIGVLGTIEPMEYDVSGIRATRRCLLIDFVFQPIPEPFVFVQGGAPHSWRRHHTGTKFANDLLPQFRVVTCRCEVQFLECEVSPLYLVVMTCHTILVEKRALHPPRSGGSGRSRPRPGLSGD